MKKVWGGGGGGVGFLDIKHDFAVLKFYSFLKLFLLPLIR